MTIDTATLDQFNEKDVLITFTNKEGVVESDVEGHAAGASPVGIAFKRKGRRDIELIEPAVVSEIRLAPKKPSKIGQKKQLPVPLDKVRQHLANNHGIGLGWLNQASNEEAAEFHASLDHTDLAHNHDKVEGEADETTPDETANGDTSGE